MDAIPDTYKKSVLIFGCGNILFGDDGFGPAVADYITKHFKVPDYAEVINVGTSVKQILFNITLSENRPKRIVIIDAVDLEKKPGEIFELKPKEIPLKKLDDFSMHQMPSSNLLYELDELCKVDVRIIVCQVEKIPDRVETGLSDIVKKSVPIAADIAMNLLDKI